MNIILFDIAEMLITFVLVDVGERIRLCSNVLTDNCFNGALAMNLCIWNERGLFIELRIYNEDFS